MQFRKIIYTGFIVSSLLVSSGVFFRYWLEEHPAAKRVFVEKVLGKKMKPRKARKADAKPASQAEKSKTKRRPALTPVVKMLNDEKQWLNTSRKLWVSDMKNRIILLDFWTYCCVNCLQTLPDLAKLEEEFGNKLLVVGVHSAKFENEKQSRNIRDAMIRYGVTHPVVNDEAFRLWKGFDVHAWPTLKLFNPKGELVSTYSGENHLPELQRDIRELIKAFPKSKNKRLPIKLEKDKAPASLLLYPAGLEVGKLEDGSEVLFISDTGHNRILITDLDGKVLQYIGSGTPGFQGGDFATAQLRSPQGMAFENGILYIADTGNHLLRAADLKAGKLRTLAGTGEKGQGFPEEPPLSPLMVALSTPWDVVFYPDKDHLVISMTGRQQLWQYDIKESDIRVLAGTGREDIKDGPALEAELAQPSGLTVRGDALYFVDAETSSLRMLKDGQITTLVGEGLFKFGYVDGDKAVARLQHPLAVEAYGAGVFVADSYNHALRRYDLERNVLSTIQVRGDKLREPGALRHTSRGLYILDTNKHRVLRLGKEQELIPVPLEMEAEVTPIAFSQDMPNLQPLDDVQLKADLEANVVTDLSEGWHINEQAPSYLALYKDDAAHTQVMQMGAEGLQAKTISLPKLAAGAYRLQTTLYYCQDGDAAQQCLISSFDVALKASDAMGQRELHLPITLPAEAPATSPAE